MDARTPIPLTVPATRCSRFAPHVSSGSNGTGTSTRRLLSLVTTASKALARIPRDSDTADASVTFPGLSSPDRYTILPLSGDAVLEHTLGFVLDPGSTALLVIDMQ